MSINKANIGNALHSVAPDHVTAVAEDIYDETLAQYQSELNSSFAYKAEQASSSFSADCASSSQTLLGEVDFKEGEYVRNIGEIYASLYSGSTLKAVVNPGDGVILPSDVNKVYSAVVGHCELVAYKDTALSELRNKVDKKCGKNLLDTSAATPGKCMASNGVVNTAALESLTDYIPVKASTSYYASGKNNSQLIGSGGFVVYYKSDFTKCQTSPTAGSNLKTFSTPADCAYVRFGYITSTEEPMLNEGTAREPYEEYSPVGGYVAGGSGDGVFDISDYNKSGSPLAPTQYADLAAALNSGANVPENKRKGGMSVRFINSGTGKYEQWRLGAASWSTDVTNWQGIDSTPTAGSQNLVTSGGVLSGIKGNPQLNYYVCETAGDNYLKSVTIPGFDLSKSNSFFYVKFLYAHTDTAHGAMLSINSDSYRYIVFEETNTETWKDGEILRFYYDGIYYRANRVDFNYRIESIVSAYKGILGEPLDFTIQGYGFYKNSLVVETNLSWIRGFVDVSNYSSQTIRLLTAIRGDAKIIIAGDNDTIIHIISASGTSNIYNIDLSLYSGAKRIYFCSETEVVRYPYAAINLATTPINEIEENINELNNLLVSEQTVSTPNAGYIDHSGNIAGETSTWKHSDIFPVRKFYSASGFIGHASVSSFAFYGTNAISSIDNNFKGYWDVGLQAVLIDKETFNSHVPTGANYFVCSTNTASAALQLKLVSNALDDLQSDIEALQDDIEDIEGSLETISGQVETNTDDIVDLKSSVRAAVISNKMLHVSFDDTINAFYDLIQNNRASLFDCPFFGTLKTLHDTYGVVFSCYCFYDLIVLKYVNELSTITNPSSTSIYYLSAVDEEYGVGYYVWRGGQWVSYDESTMRDNYVLFSLSDMTNTYAAEFTAAKDWLKFGFHSLDSTVVLSNVSASDAKTYYDNFIEDIVRITGTVETIDTAPRLQSFAGTIDVCRALRDCDCGCLGFLTADYSETSGGSGGQSVGYYLTSPAPVVLWNKGQWHDYQERLHFYPSSLRLDGQTAAATETYLNKFLTVAKYGQSEMICMYCHENQMFINGSVGSDYVASLTKVAEWAIAHGYLFGYPMNRIKCSV